MAQHAYYTAASSIHGKGVFAGRDFVRGDVIGVFEGEETADDGEHVLWIDDEATGRIYGLRGTNDLRYVNHSSKPNAEFDGEQLVALRAIRADDEITFHYGDAWNDVL